MIENYKIITITHKSAELKDIGRFVIQDSEQHPLGVKLAELKEQLSISGLFYLPTCNRVMFFFHSQGEMDTAFLQRFTKALYPDFDPTDAISKFIVHKGESAIRHLYEVSASVDSLVVGEREIIRQLRTAYTQCHAMGITDDSIRLAMNSTVRTAKQVYANTRIGEKQVSVVSLAVKKLLDVNIPRDVRILVIGAGQTNSLVCKFLMKYNFSDITIFNRSFDKAVTLAESVNGIAKELHELNDHKGGFDCMVVCTGATEPIITHEIYSQLLAGETSRKIIVDLAIPNNVADSVIQDFDIHYIEIDGLKVLANKNLAFRSKEVYRAKEIIELSIKNYMGLYKERQLEKAFGRMPEQIKQVKTKAMNEVFRKEVDELDDHTKDLLERMLSYMEKKCISIPMKVAKKTIL